MIKRHIFGCHTIPVVGSQQRGEEVVGEKEVSSLAALLGAVGRGGGGVGLLRAVALLQSTSDLDPPHLVLGLFAQLVQLF